MSKISIVTVVGARPQFVKAAVVSKALSACGKINETIVHTGQHYDANMSNIFFYELGIPAPEHHLSIGGGSHGMNTGRMLEAIESVLVEKKPDLVMVYGDTDSTLAGALAAAKLNIPIAHIEAGLRSYNRRMPEEVNRVVTDHLSSLLFVPSVSSIENLAKEGITGAKVINVGDVMCDAVKTFTPIAQTSSSILSALELTKNQYIVATVHRKENTDSLERLTSIFDGLAKSPYMVVLPLHPRTLNRLQEFGIVPHSNIRITEPLGYLDMMALTSNARGIATDSGGVQKEAYFHSVPCITMRDETEWGELVTVGANTIVGADTNAIAIALEGITDISGLPHDIYGTGNASEKIAAAIVSNTWR